MSPSSLDTAARQVLAQYAFGGPISRVVALGNRGGFSGARLWRVEAGGDVYCLRAWPPAAPSVERLRQIHFLMRIAGEAGLGFLPRLLSLPRGPSGPQHREGAGISWVEHAGRLWEVSAWMPGAADFHRRPTRSRLEAACNALARLHVAWAGVSPSVGPCPGVRRRIAYAGEWMLLVQSGWRPGFDNGPDPVRPWAERAWRLLNRHVPTVPQVLAPWAEQPLALYPCLCDIWRDHVLFVGDTVTGLVDFGSIKTDNVAVDLARLLGSMVGEDAGQREIALQAYGRVRPLSPGEAALVPVLDRTGTVLAAANWLRWLYRDYKTFEDREAVARRLAEIVHRLEP